MTDSLLELHGLAYTYPAAAWRLQDISFTLNPGEILGIIGPNGAGKSTLLRLAAGILPPHHGHVFLAGSRIDHLSRRDIARRLAYLPQNVTSTFDYRVEEVVALGRLPHLRNAGFLQNDDLDVIERCLRQTETESLRRRPLSQLSGGERQRVLLASVLAQQPDLLLLDEPTTGLDLHHQTAFFSLLAQFTRQNLAVAVVTHDLNLASLFCTRLLLLDRGRIAACGSSEDVLRQDILGPVYRHGVIIARHPLTHKPIVLPNPPSPGDTP